MRLVIIPMYFSCFSPCIAYFRDNIVMKGVPGLQYFCCFVFLQSMWVTFRCYSFGTTYSKHDPTGEVAVRVKISVKFCPIYVTSIMIITFIMFLHKQRTLSAVIFLCEPLVLSLLCLYYFRLYSYVVREFLYGGV